ncbi:MAG: glycosyl hydrolase [Bacteroidetes bacterium]|nr:MAG: glycosyl hydrolase [Bacteroidota bacterium]
MRFRTITFAILIIFVLTSVLLYSLPSNTDKTKKETFTQDSIKSETLGGLKLRSIGPALMSGRISSIAISPKEPQIWYIGVACGGVWKTTNAGVTWSPIFDNEASFSIGTISLDPNNPLVVWVGTGENNSQRSVSYGDGVYRSEDGGKSWKNMGLKKSEHIARILVDPRNSSHVYAASQGPLWASGGDRGLYKSTDGGVTWKSILTISENTGVSDLVMDPNNPDILYASAYQRRRHVWTLINGGPESGIYKSTDAGATWSKLKNGLPSVDMGRIGLAISPADSRVIYATIEAAQRKGGFFRSSDFGANWEKKSDVIASSPQYYGTIYGDPKVTDRVYLMDVFLRVSDDGGKTFTSLGDKSKHVDNHAMWIDPSNTNHYIVGCDGGLYESYDRGQNWRYNAHLPITQFYDVCVDNSMPFYYVYGGTQDNSTLGGPSRTRNSSGITNADWFITTGGDGFQSRVDPEDPNIVYSESQYGGLVRYDRRTGEEFGIQPQPEKGAEGLRWNWDSPLIISPHSHTRLYFAANILFRSDDRGDSWKPISSDLTRQIDRNTLPVMGRIWEVDAVSKNASTSLYGNCTALSESPLQEGLLTVGTDDGLIHITSDGGASWKKFEKFPDVPERTYVSRLLTSQHSVQTMYATFDNHKNADFKPYVLKSTDAGITWKSIAGNLPENGPVYAIAEDHVNPNILFVGTEFGLFVTINGGEKWIQLKSGLPTISVRDLAIQKRENDLVVATFGRGFYILDDYTPLRALATATLDQEAVTFSVKEARMFILAMPLGGSKKATQGESYYTAPNPPFGATFTYFLKSAYKTKKEIRQEAEKEAIKNKQPVYYPTWDELRAEDEAIPPEIFLTITDEAGNLIRTLSAANSKGVNRVTWDLRYPLHFLASPPPPGSDDEPDSGPFVMPGKYTATLYKRIDGIATQLGESQSITVSVLGQETMKQADVQNLAEFQKKLSRLLRTLSGTMQTATEAASKISAIKRALNETPGPVEALKTRVFALERTMNEILRNLRGDMTKRSRSENSPLSIRNRIERIADDQRMSTSPPGQTHLDAYRIGSEELSVELQKLKTLMKGELAEVEKEMESIGAPWTPGRFPEWDEQ